MHALRLEKSSSDGSKESKTADSLLASGADNGGLAVVARARSLTRRLTTGRALGARVRLATGRRSRLGSRVRTTRGRSGLGARVGRSTRGRSGLGTRVRATRRRSRLGAGLFTVVTSARRSRLGARLLTVVAVARRSGLGTVLGVGAVRRRADGKLRNLGVVGGTVGVLPRLVDDLAMLARLTVGRSVADVVVVPVIALLRLVDSEAVAVTVGAVLGNVLRTTLAGAGLGDVDVLAIAVLTGVRLEDVDDASALAGVGVALSVVALVDGGDGLGLGGGSALDGGGEGGGDGGLVGHGSSEDVGESNISAAEVDVDSEEDGVGNGRLAAAEAAAASKRSITTTELGVIARALNVARVEVDALGAIVDLVTTVAVSVVNTKVAAADTESGTLVEVHGAGRLSKLKGRETVVGTDTAEEDKVVDGSREASSRGTSGGGSSLSASGSDGLALRVGGSALRVGVGLGGSLGTSRNNGLALGVGGSTLGVGVDLSVGRDDGVGDSSSRLTLAVGKSSLSDDSGAGLSVGVATVTAAVTTTAASAIISSNLDIADSESRRVGTARLNELKLRSGFTSRSTRRGTANNAAGGLETLGEDAHTVDSDIEGAATVGTLAAVAEELNKDIEQDLDEISDVDTERESTSNGEGSDTVGPGAERNSDRAIREGSKGSTRTKHSVAEVDRLRRTSRASGSELSGGSSGRLSSRSSSRDAAVGEPLSSDTRGQGQE
jgi:hypothetical protein